MAIKNQQFENKNWLEESPELFESCVFIENNFSSAQLKAFQAYRCRFVGCRFSHADFSESLFDSCSFYDVEQDKGPDFSYANFKFAKFLDCDLSQANFKYSELFGVTIKACKAMVAQFEQANFCNKVSPKVIFAQADLIHSNFRFAKFTGLYLAQCKLSGNDFTEADFSYANCSEADLSDCILNEANFEHASLEHTEIMRSEIRNLDLSSCKLKGLKISSDQALLFLHLFGVEVE